MGGSLGGSLRMMSNIREERQQEPMIRYIINQHHCTAQQRRFD
jgi:hypothetical protein